MKQVIKKVPLSKEKVAVIHTCTEMDKINHLLENTNKLSIIITGNGDPDHGLCRKVALIGERQDKLIEGIKELNANYNVTLSEITRVGTLLKYLENSINGDKSRNRNMWRNGLTILGFIVIIAIAVFNHYTNSENNKTILSVQDTIREEVRITKGIPNVTRGWFHVNNNGLMDSIYILKK